MCAPWMVNKAHEIECSKGWKSRKRWVRARKPSKWHFVRMNKVFANCEVRTEVSQIAVSVRIFLLILALKYKILTTNTPVKSLT